MQGQVNLMPLAKTWDCGHGRELRVTVPRGLSRIAFVTVADEGHSHPLLAHRDSPAITLNCVQDELVDACLAVIAGTMTPQNFGDYLLAHHANLFHSEWRRSLVVEWCRWAVPLDLPGQMKAAMGCE